MSQEGKNNIVAGRNFGASILFLVSTIYVPKPELELQREKLKLEALLAIAVEQDDWIHFLNCHTNNIFHWPCRTD